MNHSKADDEFMELAALYALGVLEGQDARAFETHIAEGCDICAGEVASYEGVMAGLGLATDEEIPSPKVRQDLLARVADDPAGENRPADGSREARAKMVSVRASELEWREVSPGVSIKRLSIDKSTGIATSLVKMLPGSRISKHRHTGVEQLFILEGDCVIHGVSLGPGDYHRAEGGTIHESTYTTGGTTFLLIAPVSYEFWD